MASLKCWVCLTDFARDKTTREPIFAEITDECGNVHRVHKACRRSADDWIASRSSAIPANSSPIANGCYVTKKCPPAE